MSGTDGIVYIFSQSSTPSSSAAPLSSSAAVPPSSTAIVPPSSTASTAAPHYTSTPAATSSPPPVPVSSPTPLSAFPTWMAAGAAATSGHIPRALELVQFLSIYCTSLSSRQQSRVSDFQVASFTQLAMSKQDYCRVCPGACMQPLALLLPTFVLMNCLFVFGIVVAAFDGYQSHNPGSFVSPVQDRLLISASASSHAAAADGHSSLRRTTTAFCVRYFRGLIETCSSYVIMPCTFVFVLNLRSSSFEQAESWQRAMIVMLPFITVLLRALVIRQRVVQLTTADQKQLVTGSVCSCLITAVLSAYFERFQNAHQSSQSLASQTVPQYIVLALLVVQVIAQTVIRLKATEESFFDNTDWPWTSTNAQASSAVFTFDELATRLVLGSVKSASSTAAIAAAKFILLNHVPLSQMAMVVTGLASAGAASPSSIEASSVVIGCIPLVTSGALLLHNMVKLVAFLRRKCCAGRIRREQARRRSKDSFY